MRTKLTAARIATSAGCNTVICKSSSSHDIKRILHGEQIGTVFYHHPRALKQVPFHHLSCRILDSGSKDAQVEFLQEGFGGLFESLLQAILVSGNHVRAKSLISPSGQYHKK